MYHNPSAVRGNVAIVRRGGCFFSSKALFAQLSGAIAVVILDNLNPGSIGAFSGFFATKTMAANSCVRDNDIIIPVAGLDKNDAYTLTTKMDLGSTVITVSANAFLSAVDDSCSSSSSCKGNPKAMKCSFGVCVCLTGFERVLNNGTWICNQSQEIDWSGSCSYKTFGSSCDEGDVCNGFPSVVCISGRCSNSETPIFTTELPTTQATPDIQKWNCSNSYYSDGLVRCIHLTRLKGEVFPTPSGSADKVEIYRNKGHCSTKCMNSNSCIGIALFQGKCSILKDNTNLNTLKIAGWKLYSIKN
ncbi:DgyrCDS681 [Dimorphilus gyrociliatus]|nr:DgyrCDS681 [Dimorphilus gyrociliatus]